MNLASHSGEGPVTLKDISEEEGISLSYLEQLFVKLRKGNVVRSVRGPGGGYVLARPSSDISVGEVITVVEEPLNPVACLDENSKGCERAERCITQRVWKGLADRIREFLNSVSIEELSIQAKALDNRGSHPKGTASRRSPRRSPSRCKQGLLD